MPSVCIAALLRLLAIQRRRRRVSPFPAAGAQDVFEAAVRAPGLPRSANGVSPPNGRSPVGISNNTMPRENRSYRGATGLPSACSGDKQRGRRVVCDEESAVRPAGTPALRGPAPCETHPALVTAVAVPLHRCA
jgi:hypothetical protein